MRKLNLGCGPNWKKNYPSYEGLDIVDFGQEWVCDVLRVSSEMGFKEGTYDEIMANHFLEHFDQTKLKSLFQMIHFILKPRGLFKFVVPHKDKDNAWDLTHKTFWNENTVKTLERTKDFGDWEVKRIITNKRKDIHAWLRKK